MPLSRNIAQCPADARRHKAERDHKDREKVGKPIHSHATSHNSSVLATRAESDSRRIAKEQKLQTAAAACGIWGDGDIRLGTGSSCTAPQPHQATSNSHRSLFQLARSIVLIAPLTSWPSAFDVLKNRKNLFVAEHRLISRHVRLIIGNDGRKTELGDLEEFIIRVMPRVSGLIVRRCRKPSIGQPSHPVRLTLQVCPMAGRAVHRVATLTYR